MAGMDILLDTASDAEVVARTLVDTSAFALLVTRYETKLTRYIRRLGVQNPEDQQDVLQDIFIKVYKNLNAFDTSLSFSSWIYRITHNEAISFYRKKRIRPEGNLILDSEEILQFQPHAADSAETLFDASLGVDAVNSALQKLEPKYRNPIILRYFEYKEYEEISDILKIPTGSVGTLIHRGKKQLKELIPSTAR
jgi:RNA polymerase sigma-70 factor (ECF subfamily)